MGRGREAPSGPPVNLGLSWRYEVARYELARSLSNRKGWTVWYEAPC